MIIKLYQIGITDMPRIAILGLGKSSAWFQSNSHLQN
jgi:hypothetical protein